MSLPLLGVRVLDLTRMLSGPYATMILGDLGAEIIKIEQPEGDETRHFHPRLGDQSCYFLSVNRNKQSVVINLKNPEGLELFYELVRHADVVIDNFKAGVLDRLKINYRTLNKINPRVICCSITGFGLVGSDIERPAYDLIVQALSGAMSLTGEPGRPPVRMGVGVGDLAAGLIAVIGIVSAIVQRVQTGRGQLVDISLLDSLVSFLTYQAGDYLMVGEVSGPVGSSHADMGIYQAFKAKDAYFVAIAHKDRFWLNFCKAIDREDLITDPRFLDGRLRKKHQIEIDEILSPIFATENADHWIGVLRKANVPVAKVNRLDEALDEPAVKSRNMVVEMEHSSAGSFKVLGNPIKMSEINQAQLSPPPRIGEHTYSVLTSLLGKSGQAIEHLRESGAIEG